MSSKKFIVPSDVSLVPENPMRSAQRAIPIDELEGLDGETKPPWDLGP